MKIKSGLIIILIFVFYVAFGNQTEIDSLLQLHKSSEYEKLPDTIKADICRKLSIENVRKSSKIALAYAEELYSIAKTTGDETDEAIALNLIGVCIVNQGDLEKGLDYYLQSLLVRKRIGDSKMISNTANNIGTVYVRLGDFKKGLDYYNQALQLRIENDDSVGVAQTFNNIGVTYKIREGYDSAIVFLEKSLAIKRELNDKELIASSLNNLGELAAINGDDEKAMACFEEALMCREMIDDVYGASKTLNSMSKFVAQHGEYYEAIRYLQKALVLQIVGFDDTSIYANPVYGLHEIDFNAIILLKNKADNFKDIFNRNPENIKSLQVSFDLHILIIDFIDKIRIGYDNERSKMHLMQSNRDIYSDAVTIAIMLLNATGDEKYKSKAFELEERGKARILLDLILENEAKVDLDIPDSLLKNEIGLKKEIAGLQKYIFELPENDEEKTDSANRLIFEMKRQLENFTQILEEKYPEYLRLKYMHSNPTLDDVQELLAPDELFLQYHINDTILYTFINTTERNGIMQTALLPDFYEHLNILKSFLTSGSAGNIGSTNNEYSHAAFRLYEYLVYPFEQFFDKQKLIIVPDGPLFYIPFGVLLNQAPDTNNVGYTDLPYLIKKYPITYSYSSSMFINARKASSDIGEEDLVAFALSFKKNEYNYSSEGYNEIAKRGEELSELPGVKAEVGNILQIISGKAYYDSLATESQFKTLEGHQKILHVATHGIINNTKPMFSRLVFEPDQALNEDGNLYTWELFNMQMNAEMAVLSACNTGYGKLQLGEGMMTLARGFMYAGVPSLVISLWNVNDESTATIMTKFYHYLNEGQNKEVALQLAKVDYLKSSDDITANPWFWGGFVHLGNTSKMEFGNNLINQYTLFFTGMILTLFVLFIVVKRKVKKN